MLNTGENCVKKYANMKWHALMWENFVGQKTDEVFRNKTQREVVDRLLWLLYIMERNGVILRIIKSMRYSSIK